MLWGLALFLLLAGCGRDAEPTPTPSPTATPSPTPAAMVNVRPPTLTPTPFPLALTPTPPPEPSPVSQGFLTADRVLESFRSRGTLVITTIFPDGQSRQTLINYESAYQQAANRFGFNERIRLTSEERTGSGSGQTEEVEVYSVDNWVAIRSRGEWLTAVRDQVNDFMRTAEIFSDPMRQLTWQMAEAEAVGAERIEDVETIQYRSQDPEIFIEAAGARLLAGEALEEVTIDVWVAREGSYVVRYTISARISNALELDDNQQSVETDQALEWLFELYAINDETIDIQLPLEVPNVSTLEVPGFASGTFPLPPGARLESAGLAQPLILVPLPEAEVLTFYQEQLGEQGWQLEGGFGVYRATLAGDAFDLLIGRGENGLTTVQVVAQ